MMHVRMAQISTAVILTFVLVNVGQFGYDKWYESQPPIEWIGAEAITKVVKKGDIFRAKYKAIVYKQCPADLTHFLVAPDGTSPVRFDDTRGGYRIPTDGKETEINFSIQIPIKAFDPLVPYPPGVYTYRVIAKRYCGMEPYLDNGIPDVKFKLED